MGDDNPSSESYVHIEGSTVLDGNRIFKNVDGVDPENSKPATMGWFYAVMELRLEGDRLIVISGDSTGMTAWYNCNKVIANEAAVVERVQRIMTDWIKPK